MLIDAVPQLHHATVQDFWSSARAEPGVTSDITDAAIMVDAADANLVLKCSSSTIACSRETAGWSVDA
ncbi:hypothetical protein [Saccharothrix xinjiangensis]|uniref:Uncharacterized protein n=1 Tax=Saccharothrix xinjiangensis TaxID=204798 RepID=A0ABV9XUR8_9PSEU